MTEPELSEPWYGLALHQAVARAFRKYAWFRGRASQGEFWWFFLAQAIIVVPLFLVFLVTGPNWLAALFGAFDAPDYTPTGHVLLIVLGAGAAITLVPNVAAGVRRLHDAGRSGWWILLTFVPPAVAAFLHWFPLYRLDPHTGNTVIWTVLVLALACVVVAVVLFAGPTKRTDLGSPAAPSYDR